MTLVIDPHPILDAAASAVAAVFFIGMTLFVMWVCARRWRRALHAKQRVEARRQTITMAVCSIFIVAFTAMGWFNADPHTVVLGDDAMELRYVWSSREIPYSEIRRIEFGVHRNRGVERHYVVLKTADAPLHVTSEVHPPSPLAVRTLFDELTRRVPGATVPPESQATWAGARDHAAKRGY